MKKECGDLCRQTVAALRAGLESGEITSEAIVQAYLDSIAMQNSAINAYVEVTPQEALAEAEQADARRQAGVPLSPLDGIPVAVKDNILWQGKHCTCASQMLADFVAPYDATVMKRLRAAGMPLLGRLNMDEFSMGDSTETSLFGPTRNPWDLAFVPGGSSGGAGAAVAAGMAPVALGSDTGGSVRQPAAFCGVVGVKPAYGTVSRYGLVAYASSLEQIGPICKTAQDAALVMGVIAGADPRDATSDGRLAEGFRRDALQALQEKSRQGEKPLEGVTLGLMQGPLHGAVEQALAQAVLHWQALGVRFVEVSLPRLPQALAAYVVISCAEASSNLARYDGTRFGHQAEALGHWEALCAKSRREGFGLEVQQRILLGTWALSGEEPFNYQRAQRVREAFGQEMDAALAGCDGLLLPVTATPAYPMGEKAAGRVDGYQGDLFTVPANLTGLPALSLPCGLSPEGLPIGMQLLGQRESLPWLLALGQVYEQAYPVAVGQHPYDRLQKGGKAP